MTHRSDRTLVTKGLARVEGEGAMYVRVSGGQVEEVRLDIYEPPRFFEAFLRGRAFTEPPDITARICGICPVAYQTSACQAIEEACGVSPVRAGPGGDGAQRSHRAPDVPDPGNRPPSAAGHRPGVLPPRCVLLAWLALRSTDTRIMMAEPMTGAVGTKDPILGWPTCAQRDRGRARAQPAPSYRTTVLSVGSAPLPVVSSGPAAHCDRSSA